MIHYGLIRQKAATEKCKQNINKYIDFKFLK